VGTTGGPGVVPTQTEMSLLVVAGYESQLRIQSVEARRRFHATGILMAVAGLVFSYDFLSVFLSR
jgi:hypothetical protein